MISHSALLRGGLWIAFFALLSAPGPASAQRDRPPRGGPGDGPGPDSRPAPPAFAVEACAGKSEGSACSAETPRGPLQGACSPIGAELACIPDRNRPPSRTTRIAPPPARESEVPAALRAPAPIEASVPSAPPSAPPPAETAPPPPPASAAAAPSATAAGSLLPLAAVLAAAAVLFFALWKFVAQLKAEPATAAYRPATAPRAEPPSPPSAAPAPRPITASTPAAPPLGPSGGLVIGGNYEVGRQLGVGGMGVVYEGHDLTLDRRVALKKMKAEIGTSRRGRELFLSEARLVAKLQHPNIVAIHAIIEDAGDLYLVFEYVDGETLDDLILREKFLAPQRALELLSGVAAAVDHAHAERVIHRDLKPANIMIDKHGRPKVMDFGIAHQAKITISQMTMAAAYGTLAYMPPEQELGKAVRESDIYAFAAVTYEALTGGLAFPGPNFHLQKASMSFLRPSQADPTLPRGLDEIFERAFQPEPKSRHPTTGEFVKALDGALTRKRGERH